MSKAQNKAYGGHAQRAIENSCFTRVWPHGLADFRWIPSFSGQDGLGICSPSATLIERMTLENPCPLNSTRS